MKIRNILTTLTIAGATALFAAAPLAAQATQSICKDGTTDATVGRGACGHHGGVDKAAMKAAAASAKMTAKATKAPKAAKAAAASPMAATPATPATPAKPASGAQVTCKDGTMSAAGRGACGHHGGVMKAGAAPAATPATPAKPSPMAAAAPRASRAAAPAAAGAAVAGNGSHEDNNPAGAIAKCKDGMYSHAAHRTGACGHHGGVAQWMGQ